MTLQEAAVEVQNLHNELEIWQKKPVIAIRL